MSYFIFHDDEHKRQQEARYWNPSTDDEYHPTSLNICVVASITKRPDGEMFDWAAYIGAAPGVDHALEALMATARYGAKLSEKDARYFFPDIDAPYRR